MSGRYIGDNLRLIYNLIAYLNERNVPECILKRIEEAQINLLELFYHTTVESIVTFNSLCFCGSLKEHDRPRLSRIMKTASKLIGAPVIDIQSHFEAKAVKQLRAIFADPSNPLNDELMAQTRDSSDRLLSVRARTNRFLKSFLPTAIRLFNAQLSIHSITVEEATHALKKMKNAKSPGSDGFTVEFF